MFEKVLNTPIFTEDNKTKVRGVDQMKYSCKPYSEPQQLMRNKFIIAFYLEGFTKVRADFLFKIYYSRNRLS